MDKVSRVLKRRTWVPAMIDWRLDVDLARRYIYHAGKMENYGVDRSIMQLAHNAAAIFCVTSDLAETHELYASYRFDEYTPRELFPFPYFPTIKEKYHNREGVPVPQCMATAFPATEFPVGTPKELRLVSAATQEQRENYLRMLQRHNHLPDVYSFLRSSFQLYELMWAMHNRDMQIVGIPRKMNSGPKVMNLDYFSYKPND